MPRRILVTGGVRSGKSSHAERLLAEEDPVTYVAPGGPVDATDAEWAERVAIHQARRPPSWRTVEDTDVAAALRAAKAATLVDCLGTWVTAMLDDLNAWDSTGLRWPDELDRRVHDLLSAVSDFSGQVVLVTNEVGMGVVPEHRSGRVFRDVLGTVNQRVASVCDDVVLMVAGRMIRL